MGKRLDYQIEIYRIKIWLSKQLLNWNLLIKWLKWILKTYKFNWTYWIEASIVELSWNYYHQNEAKKPSNLENIENIENIEKIEWSIDNRSLN